MKVVILAGGFGTRLSEETHLKPKPMVEIGDWPILWHIMKLYSHYGFNDFVLCLGYKSYVIKEYFANYKLHNSDVTFDFGKDEIKIHKAAAEDWSVTCIDTGLNTMTGGRLQRIRSYLSEDEPFFMTYGDGVANVDLHALKDFHTQHGKLATVTAVQPQGRFGALDIDPIQQVRQFEEKPEGDGAWINGGFFVLNTKALDDIAGDHIMFEREPLAGLAQGGQLSAFFHKGFWKPMDSLRDKRDLEALWNSGDAPWKVWND